MELGIAGVPDDLSDIMALCQEIGVAPVFVLGPDEALPKSDQPLHIHHVPAWDQASCCDRLGDAGLAGLWAADRARRDIVAAVSAYLGFPHLPCPDDKTWLPECIVGARLLDLNALGRIADADSASLDLPVWVRASCGNGDSSCMRVDHPGDLSLASAKLEKRNAAGAIRVQPVVDGPVYRLMAFKTGRELIPVDIVAEEMTSSVYRVPLGYSMPVPRRGTLLNKLVAEARRVNRGLPHGWGYLEMEFVVTEGDSVHLVDVQMPASVDPLLREVVRISQGIDLRKAVLQCAVGRPPRLTPVRELGVASTWLLTRSGVVTGFKGIEEARAMPGIARVDIVAEEGDVLSHVVDTQSRGRGGYIIATGTTCETARQRLEVARENVWINTSPAVS